MTFKAKGYELPIYLIRFLYVWLHSLERSSVKKGGVKAHVLYDIEAQVPAFYTVTTVSKNDSTVMSAINYELNAYYIFDRAYDSFKKLYRIHLTGSFLVVRAKSNLKYKFCKWKRRIPKNILSDAEVKLIGYNQDIYIVIIQSSINKKFMYKQRSKKAVESDIFLIYMDKQ